MSKPTLIIVLSVAVAMLVVGLVVDVVALAVIGLFGAAAVAAVAALAAGGDWIRDASAGRFRHDGR